MEIKDFIDKVLVGDKGTKTSTSKTVNNKLHSLDKKSKLTMELNIGELLPDNYFHKNSKREWLCNIFEKSISNKSVYFVISESKTTSPKKPMRYSVEMYLPFEIINLVDPFNKGDGLMNYNDAERFLKYIIEYNMKELYNIPIITEKFFDIYNDIKNGTPRSNINSQIQESLTALPNVPVKTRFLTIELKEMVLDYLYSIN